MQNEITIYNTLTQRIEPFRPQNEVVSIYVCGITPYDTTHLGHIFTYAAADVLIRYFLHRNFRVKYVQNLTDIDDPIFREAKKRDEDWKELGRRWTVHYVEDMKTMNILPPAEFPKASEVIGDMINTIQKLLEAGVAYESAGNVYLEVDKWEKLGELSRIPREEMLPVANGRGNNQDDPNKRNPLDFQLWRTPNKGEPSWESRWGMGLPGWHIECSTMASKYLGDTIDIHGGGTDLIFPHHEGEIAQSENATGKQPFVRYWFHTAMVRHEGKKMSKSIGNLVMVRDILKKVSPDGLRLYLSNHHYRGSWEFNPGQLEDSETLAQKLRNAFEATGGPSTAEALEADGYRRDFLNAMNNDLQTPNVVRLLSDLADAILDASEKRRNINYAKDVLTNICEVIGLQAAAGKPEDDVIKGWNRHLEKI